MICGRSGESLLSFYKAGKKVSLFLPLLSWDLQHFFLACPPAPTFVTCCSSLLRGRRRRSRRPPLSSSLQSSSSSHSYNRRWSPLRSPPPPFPKHFHFFSSLVFLFFIYFPPAPHFICLTKGLLSAPGQQGDHKNPPPCDLGAVIRRLMCRST